MSVPNLRNICLSMVAALVLAGCSANYSPDTYASNAVQVANKVDIGIVIGFREVLISANGTVGAVSGGAAGGVLGAQIGSSNFDNALGGVAGSAVGSMLGRTIEHVTGDTTGWEYIVRKSNGDLISVTQTEPKPLGIGQRVLVINGPQARIIPDYSKEFEPADKPSSAIDADKSADKPKVAEKKVKKPAAPELGPVVPAAERAKIEALPPPAPKIEATATELPNASSLLPDEPAQ